MFNLRAWFSRRARSKREIGEREDNWTPRVPVSDTATVVGSWPLENGETLVLLKGPGVELLKASNPSFLLRRRSLSVTVNVHVPGQKIASSEE